MGQSNSTFRNYQVVIATRHITEQDVQKWDSNYGTINNYLLVIATDLSCRLHHQLFTCHSNWLVLQIAIRQGGQEWYSCSTLDIKLWRTHENRLESRYTTEQGGQEWCNCWTLDIKLWRIHRNQLKSWYTTEQGGQEWCSYRTLDINLW